MSQSAVSSTSPGAEQRRIGVEASKTIGRKIESGFVAKYLSGGAILDIGYRGYIEDVEPVVPQAIGIELDYPGYDGRRLPFDDQTQDAVFASHCLEHIEDYQNALSDWHRVLKIGGFMIIAVPHQYLYERRTRPPSRWNEDHKRFYTPASLMREVEQSLDPNTYRLRHLADNDLWYDYPQPLEAHPGGCYEVELVLERIAPPAWKLETPPAAMAQTAPLPAPAPAPAQSILGAFASGYRKLRYFPRHTITLLNDLAAELSKQGQKQDALATDTAAALHQLQVELGTLRESGAASLAQVRADLGALRDATAASLSDTRTKIDECSRRLDVADNHLARVEIFIERQPHQLEAAARAAVDPLIGRLDQQAARIEHLGIVVAEQARMLPSWPWSPETASRVRAILAPLAPAAAREVAKIRVGRAFDGGYIMLDDFAGIGAALSLGIADDVSWDASIADRGIPVLQFDPAVPAPPSPHDNFRFERLSVAAEDGDGAVRLETILQTRVDAGDRPLLLKIDVEGAEWEIIQAADSAILPRFKQIVCEFHDLDRLAEDQFGERAKAVFEKLARTHFVFHVHGNNCGSFTNVGNVVVPQTIEVSFARREDYDPVQSDDEFPTALDYPNQPGRADLFLGRFRF